MKVCTLFQEERPLETYLSNVFAVLKRIGYDIVTGPNVTDFDFLYTYFNFFKTMDLAYRSWTPDKVVN